MAMANCVQTSVVTLHDRSGRSEVTCTAEESSDCSTSESDIDQEFFDLQGDERKTDVTDFFPTQKAETEIALPSVEEAKAQIEKIKARCLHISEIARRYSGAQSHQAQHDSKVCPKAPMQLPQVLQSALQDPVGFSFDSLRQKGIDADLTKLKAGLAKEEAQREELWMKFLCGNDAPVGGDALPSPDEFLGTKGYV